MVWCLGFIIVNNQSVNLDFNWYLSYFCIARNLFLINRTLDVASLDAVKNLHNQNTKVKTGYLTSAVSCVQTPVFLLPGISRQFRQMHQWGYSLTGSPGEASLKSSTSTHAWKASLHLLQEPFLLLMGEAPTFTSERKRKCCRHAKGVSLNVQLV